MTIVERVTAASPDDMHDLGVRLGRVLAAGDLVILTGPLGAGKTTLTRGLGAGLGVRGPVQSPTFVIARTHPSLVGGAPLVHVDAYRLSNSDELDDLDLDFEASVVVAEWGAGVLDPEGSWIEIEIERPTGAGGAGAGADPDPVAALDTVLDAALDAALDATKGAAPDVTTAAAAGAAAGAAAADDVGEDWSEAPVEARHMTLTGHGPRWAGGILT